jgi:hypothetical protein
MVFLTFRITWFPIYALKDKSLAYSSHVFHALFQILQCIYLVRKVVKFGEAIEQKTYSIYYSDEVLTAVANSGLSFRCIFVTLTLTQITSWPAGPSALKKCADRTPFPAGETIYFRALLRQFHTA